MLLHVRSSLLGGLWSEKLGSALAVVMFGLGLADTLIARELLTLGQIRYGLLFFCLSIETMDNDFLSNLVDSFCFTTTVIRSLLLPWRQANR
jgi:hypothetical protein